MVVEAGVEELGVKQIIAHLEFIVVIDECFYEHVDCVLGSVVVRQRPVDPCSSDKDSTEEQQALALPFWKEAAETSFLLEAIWQKAWLIEHFHDRIQRGRDRESKFQRYSGFDGGQSARRCMGSAQERRKPAVVTISPYYSVKQP